MQHQPTRVLLFKKNKGKNRRKNLTEIKNIEHMRFVSLHSQNIINAKNNCQRYATCFELLSSKGQRKMKLNNKKLKTSATTINLNKFPVPQCYELVFNA